MNSCCRFNAVRRREQQHVGIKVARGIILMNFNTRGKYFGQLAFI